MTAKQKAYRKSLLMAVHVSPKWRQYYKDDREAYEAALHRAFGVRSAANLTLTALDTWVQWLTGRIDTLPEYQPERITEPQIRKIREQWQAYARDQSDIALLRFVRRVSGGEIYLQVEQLSKQAATKTILALSKNLKE